MINDRSYNETGEKQPLETIFGNLVTPISVIEQNQNIGALRDLNKGRYQIDFEDVCIEYYFGIN